MYKINNKKIDNRNFFVKNKYLFSIKKLREYANIINIIGLNKNREFKIFLT